jgi:hypothetical protein
MFTQAHRVFCLSNQTCTFCACQALTKLRVYARRIIHSSSVTTRKKEADLSHSAAAAGWMSDKVRLDVWIYDLEHSYMLSPAAAASRERKVHSTLLPLHLDLKGRFKCWIKSGIQNTYLMHGQLEGVFLFVDIFLIVFLDNVWGGEQ